MSARDVFLDLLEAWEELMESEIHEGSTEIDEELAALPGLKAAWLARYDASPPDAKEHQT